jgi:PEP-CTERM motif
MKTTHTHIFSLLLAATLAVGATLSSNAATVVAGGAIISYDQSAFFVLTDPNFFDASSNNLTYNQVINQANAGNTVGAWTGLEHVVNGATLPGGTRSTVAATNFSYTPSNITGTATGQIGLGGITRFSVPPGLGGGILTFGDMSLVYNSGWKVMAAFGWGSPYHAFDVNNVNLTESGTGFTLTGDLAATPAIAGFYQIDGTKPTGTINLTASTVPEPSTVVMGAIAICGLLARRRRNA